MIYNGPFKPATHGQGVPYQKITVTIPKDSLTEVAILVTEVEYLAGVDAIETVDYPSNQYLGYKNMLEVPVESFGMPDTYPI
ncbi:hypothetical protein CONCODRAFT_9167 [Conidiobolus coronatus NRRL 28638]|uniref:Uncharacterized protein n=1 Tax=Conidiobolus coronatus (strain ATCC 28846 / CBS 209.66 / NRRL 28638) TaxID=796925 RepID=A0A137P123_CONC2|nr:hypothetical protein CONCODRAFT_9167 [Conidiobolus coronatus NRRL 28638]|eukprot:KXN68571.1 hypothetical protein CONCODRAFT_9167 [Conidiobolus coronatus NRRL 28638]